MLIFFLQTQVFSALMTFQFQFLKTDIVYQDFIFISYSKYILLHLCVENVSLQNV